MTFAMIGAMDEVSLAPFALTPAETIGLTWKLRVKPLVKALSITMFLFTCTIWWFLGLAFGPASPSPLYVPLLAIAFVILGLVRFRHGQLPAAFRKADPVTFANRSFSMGRESCQWTYEGGLQTRLPWRMVRRVQVIDGIYLLYRPGGTAFWLPRRALTSDQEHFLVDRLREVGQLP